MFFLYIFHARQCACHVMRVKKEKNRLQCLCACIKFANESLIVIFIKIFNYYSRSQHQFLFPNSINFNFILRSESQ